MEGKQDQEVIQMSASPYANFAPATNPTAAEKSEAQALAKERREAQQAFASRCGLDKFCRLACTCLGSMILIGVLLAAILALPIAMIYVGRKYNDRCPVEDLPNILLSGGIIFIIQGFVAPCFNVKKDAAKFFNGLVALAELCWFIAAAVLVYRSNISDNLNDPNYCHPAVYKFVWWIVTVILGSCIVSISICLGAVYHVRRRRNNF
ncbi:transmembrane protein 272 isoform X2 [Folsomia candida]|nr:transmembrane protein 272 isoform X2 [Folsomia candida]